MRLCKKVFCMFLSAGITILLIQGPGSTATTQFGMSVDNYPCNDNGNDCSSTNPVYARSVAGVTPSRYITWFQAQQACGMSGKRLITNAEWQMAAAGTPDPGTSDNSSFTSATNSALSSTGTRSNCYSNWSAHDMVGNLWEWVADWMQDNSNSNAGDISTATYSLGTETRRLLEQQYNRRSLCHGRNDRAIRGKFDHWV